MTPNENGAYFTIKALLEEPVGSEKQIDSVHCAMGWSSYGWLWAISIYRREKDSQQNMEPK